MQHWSLPTPVWVLDGIGIGPVVTRAEVPKRDHGLLGPYEPRKSRCLSGETGVESAGRRHAAYFVGSPFRRHEKGHPCLLHTTVAARLASHSGCGVYLPRPSLSLQSPNRPADHPQPPGQLLGRAQRI